MSPTSQGSTEVRGLFEDLEAESNPGIQQAFNGNNLVPMYCSFALILGKCKSKAADYS